MSDLTHDGAMKALATVLDPDLQKDLVTLGMVKDVKVEGTHASVRVVLTTPACPMKAKIKADVEEALAGAGAETTDVIMDAEVRRVAPAG